MAHIAVEKYYGYQREWDSCGQAEAELKGNWVMLPPYWIQLSPIKPLRGHDRLPDALGVGVRL